MKRKTMSISNVDIKDLDSEEGSVALRDFFSELFAERLGTNCSSGTEDADDYLSSDEETAVATDQSLIKNTPKINNKKSINNQDSNQDRIEKNNDLNSNTNHTRRGRFRRSRGLKPQRPTFALSQDNARGLPSLSKHSSGELRVSSYHCNSMSSTSLHKSSAHNKYSRTNKKNRHSLSASAHSLGSRTGISDTSVTIWRNSLHMQNSERGMQRGRQMIRSHHRDSRWSTSGTEIPSYDSGVVNDSLHTRNVLRSKNRMNIRQDRTNSNHSRNRSLRKNNLNDHVTHLNDSSSLALKAIESAVRVVSNHVSSDDSSEGEEFYEDDDVSLSSFTASHDPSSKAESSVTTNGSSLDFYTKYKIKAKAKSLYPSRGFPTRTKSNGDLPQVPIRSMDDLFEFAESFEPLKDKSSDNGSFQKSTLRRSMSDDISMSTIYSFGSKSNISTSPHCDSPKAKPRRHSDPFGRWAATVTTKVDSLKNRDSSLRCPTPPRRVPSMSMSESFSNYSKVFSEPTTTDCESSECESSECETADTFGFDTSYDDHNSFADCQYDTSDSLAATMATTGSSSPGSGSSSNTSGTTSASSYEKDAYKTFLSDTYNSHHQRMSFPESLRKLPQHSFHMDAHGNNSSTTGSNSLTTATSSSISTSGSGIPRHQGKSLLTTNKSRFR